MSLLNHSVFTQGTIWRVDSTRSVGGDLGEVLATQAPQLDQCAHSALPQRQEFRIGVAKEGAEKCGLE